MPTTRARYTLTETPALAEALDAAADTWPELRDDRAALLRRLVEAGHQAVVRHTDDRVGRRREAVQAVAGTLTGVYPRGAADELKSEWPE